jgi:hypothetical protein
LGKLSVKRAETSLGRGRHEVCATNLIPKVLVQDSQLQSCPAP